MYKSRFSIGNNYTTIQSFGEDTSGDHTTNPLELSLSKTVDKSFRNGVNSYNFNPSSQYSQLYLAQFCAENWNGMCETITNDTTMAFNAVSKFRQPGVYANQQEPLGVITLRNIAEEKYCKVPGTTSKFVQYNPVDSTSPLVRIDTAPSIYRPVCSVEDITATDSDPIMNKILDNPYPYLPILENMFKTHLSRGEDLRSQDTRLGRFCASYFK